MNCIIVVPCYNEAARLNPEAFRRFVSQVPDVRFVMVDDGSSDGTLDVLRGLERDDPAHFVAFRLVQNSGKAEAVRQGMIRALEERPRMAGFWDADLATPLAAVSEFRDVLDRHPRVVLVAGARVRLLGRTIERQWLRHYLGRIFATAASLVVGLPTYDTQCGAKLFRVEEGLGDLFARPFCTRWIFDVELLARLVCRASGGSPDRVEDRIYELPLTEWHDVTGSKLRPRDFVKAFVDLVRIGWRYRWSRRDAEPAARPAADTVPSPTADAAEDRRAA